MKHLFSFHGRAERFEWWVVSLLADLAFQLCLIFGMIEMSSSKSFHDPAAGALFIGAALSLWLALAVTVRRLRDRGRSPWLMLFALIPVVGWVWFVIECGLLPAPGSRVPRRLVRRIVTAPEGAASITRAIESDI